ncbi:MAG: fasciclin domain-containing protein [Leeuwenhoekiella sp.]
MKKLFLSLATVGLILTGCGDTEKKENTEADMDDQETMAYESENSTTMEDAEMDSPGTVVEVAVGNENFSTLVTAVKAAGLVETLNGDGPYTVFAPTNAAFDKLPEGTVGELVKEENKDKLSGILTYHVVAGKFMAADVVKAIQDNNGSFEITTVEGGVITATLEGDSVILTDENNNKSTIIMTDVDASNGVIHAIDTVVMPG